MSVTFDMFSIYNQVILVWLCTIYVLILTGIFQVSEEKPVSNFCIIFAYSSLNVPQDKKKLNLWYLLSLCYRGPNKTMFRLALQASCYLDVVAWKSFQGSYGSWKTWKVMEFYNLIPQAWKGMEFRCGSWKVLENQYTFFPFLKGNRIQSWKINRWVQNSDLISVEQIIVLT